MREIDVAHQAEDQREAARDQKIEPAERDPVERGIEKQFFPAEHGFEARRPGREHQPQRRDDDDEDEQRR